MHSSQDTPCEGVCETCVLTSGKLLYRGSVHWTYGMTVRASNINQDRDCYKFITSTTRNTDASENLSE